MIYNNVITHNNTFFFVSQFVVFAIFKLENLTKASIIHLHALST
jgi:hypothetical protein